MISPDTHPIPMWVRSFCCIAPPVALIGLVIAAIAGYSIASAAFAVVSLLCGNVNSMLLRSTVGVPRSTLEVPHVINEDLHRISES